MYLMAQDGETIVNSEKVYFEINSIDTTQDELLNDLLEIDEQPNEDNHFILARSYSDDTAILEMYRGTLNDCKRILNEVYFTLRKGEDFDFRKG